MPSAGGRDVLLQCPFLPVIAPDPIMNVQNVLFSFSIYLRKDVESLRLGFSREVFLYFLYRAALLAVMAYVCLPHCFCDDLIV